MKNKVLWIIGLSFFVLFFVLLSGYVAGRKSIKEREAQIETLKAENQTFKTTITKNDAIITTQRQRIATLESAEQALLIDNKALRDKGIKDVQTIINLKTEIKRLNFEAQYNRDTVIVHDPAEPLKGDYLKLPASFSYSDNWLDLAGTNTVKGVTIDKNITYSELSIIMGYSRGFFQKSKPIIVFEDKNPHTIVRNMDNVVIYHKPPFYKTAWWHRFEGALMIVGTQIAVNQLNK